MSFDVKELSENIDVDIRSSPPKVVSIGKDCMELGYSFTWETGQAPFLTSPIGEKIYLDVYKKIPYLTESNLERLFDDIHNLPSNIAVSPAVGNIVPGSSSGIAVSPASDVADDDAASDSLEQLEGKLWHNLGSRTAAVEQKVHNYRQTGEDRMGAIEQRLIKIECGLVKQHEDKLMVNLKLQKAIHYLDDRMKAIERTLDDVEDKITNHLGEKLKVSHKLQNQMWAERKKLENAFAAYDASFEQELKTAIIGVMELLHDEQHKFDIKQHEWHKTVHSDMNSQLKRLSSEVTRVRTEATKCCNNMEPNTEFSLF